MGAIETVLHIPDTVLDLVIMSMGGLVAIMLIRGGGYVTMVVSGGGYVTMVVSGGGYVTMVVSGGGYVHVTIILMMLVGNYSSQEIT